MNDKTKKGIKMDKSRRTLPWGLEGVFSKEEKQ